MKKKIFSVLLTLVLILSLGLMMAMPVGAQGGTATVSLDIDGDGIAEWSTAQARSGSHSAYLKQVTPDSGSLGAVVMEVDPIIPIADFTGVSFFVWEPTGTVHDGEFPGAWNIPYPYGDPYIYILLDTDGDDIFDDALVGTASVTLGTSPTTPHTGPAPDTWVEMEEGYGFRDSNGSLNLLSGVTTPHEWYAGPVYFDGDSVPPRDPPGEVWRINDVGTIEEWQGWFADNALTVTVVGVYIVFGDWLDDPVMGVYVDDVTINGLTYNLEADGSVGVTVDIPEITAISVTPTNINFGTLYPGDSSGVTTLTVQNIGTVTIDVDARVDPTTTVFNNLWVGAQSVPTTGLITGLAGGITDSVNVQLVVPPTYSAKGVETATLIFEATATP